MYNMDNLIISFTDEFRVLLLYLIVLLLSDVTRRVIRLSDNPLFFPVQIKKASRPGRECEVLPVATTLDTCSPTAIKFSNCIHVSLISVHRHKITLWLERDLQITCTQVQQLASKRVCIGNAVWFYGAFTLNVQYLWRSRNVFSKLPERL
jgi:hypothetical protein